MLVRGRALPDAALGCGRRRGLPVPRLPEEGSRGGKIRPRRLRQPLARSAINVRRSPRPFTEIQRHDRPLRADQSQRAEDFHHARRVRAALQRQDGRRLEGRAVHAGVHQDQPAAEGARDRRSRRPRRQAVYVDRIRRDPDVSRREDRQVHPARSGQALRHAAMAGGAGRQSWTDVGPGRAFQQIRRPRPGLRHQPLSHRAEQALRHL